MKKIIYLLILLALLPVFTQAQIMTQIDITVATKITFLWTLPLVFTDGSAIDTTIYDVFTELQYRKKDITDTTWVSVADIKLPKLFYNATNLIKGLSIGEYEFEIVPFVSLNEISAYGKPTTSIEKGFTVIKKLLPPGKHDTFSITIEKQ